MKRKTTKEILSESFRELAQSKNIDKITIQNIVDNCDYSPATFYRNFKDKYDIIAWDYAQKTAQIINRIDGEHIPPFLIASITSKCNLHCAGCYSRCNHATVDSEPVCQLTSEGWLRVFNEADDLGISFILLAGDQPVFSYPIGADSSGMIDELTEYAYKNHLPLRFFAVDDDTLDKIRADKRLQPAMWAYDRRWSDYIYSFEEAMTFKGKKYSGQRNHINKFKKLYGEPVCPLKSVCFLVFIFEKIIVYDYADYLRYCISRVILV